MGGSKCQDPPTLLTVVCLPSQGMISLVLQCVDRLHVYSSAAHFAEVAGREAGESWKSILNSLYELLGKKWLGFRGSCCVYWKGSPGTHSPFSSCFLLKPLVFTRAALRAVMFAIESSR